MTSTEAFPAIHKAQEALAPYIKTRQETSRIRHVLAAFIESQIEQKGFKQARVLPLQETSATIKSSHGTIRGVRKEYLKCLHSNNKARQEYDVHKYQHVSEEAHQTRVPRKGNGFQLEAYLDLIKKRQKQERLRILQHYTDTLAQKLSIFVPLLDKASSINEDLPCIPVAFIVGTEDESTPSHFQDLQMLLHQLERTVLAVKGRLKKEKQALERLREQKNGYETLPPLTAHAKIQALGETRNELISWVEEELGRAGEAENPSTVESGQSFTKEVVEERLEFVKQQYVEYINSRKRFLDAMATKETLPIKEDVPESSESRNVETAHSFTQHVTPFLEDLVFVSSEQKSLIQQRSHLTTSLAKQSKETTKIFDRLAHESHLLQSFPLPSNYGRPGQGASLSFAKDISGGECEKSTERAKAWTYASALAATDAKDVVLEHLEEGGSSIEEARAVLSTIDKMLGRANSDDHEDLWATIDGQVGVLGREESY